MIEIASLNINPHLDVDAVAAKISKEFEERMRAHAKSHRRWDISLPCFKAARALKISPEEAARRIARVINGNLQGEEAGPCL